MNCARGLSNPARPVRARMSLMTHGAGTPTMTTTQTQATCRHCLWRGPVPAIARCPECGDRNLRTQQSEDRLRDALRAVLLFHRGGPWTAESRRYWRQITGCDEATTKVLCDTVRRALG